MSGGGEAAISGIMRGLEPRQTAARGGDADGPAAVGGVCDIHQPAGDGHSSAAGGTAGSHARMHGIDGCQLTDGLGVRHDTEL